MPHEKTNRDELERLVGTLLELTVPPDGPVDWLDGNQLSPVLGLLWRARSLLTGILVLYRLSAENLGGEVLSRSVFEHAVTGVWMLQDLEEHSRQFVQAGNKELCALAARDSWFQHQLEMAQRRWAASRWRDGDFAGDLPEIKSRLVGGVKDDPHYYMWYRYLNWWAHPSVVTVGQQLEKTPDGVLIHSSPIDHYSDNRLVLPFAGLMYAWLALELEKKAPGLFGELPVLKDMVVDLFNLMDDGPPRPSESRSCKAAAKGRDVADPDELETLIGDLLHLAGPPPSDVPVTDLEDFLLWPVLGLLTRTSSLIRGLLALYQSSALRFGGEVIARSVFEHSATGIWILEDPDERVRHFVQSGNRDVRTVFNETGDRWFEELLDDTRLRWEKSEWGGTDFAKKLPGVSARLVGPLEEYQKYYTWYRYLSGWAHPSLLAINQQWEKTPVGTKVHSSPIDRYTNQRLTLPFGALNYWVFVMCWTGKVNPQSEYLPLLADMGAYLNRYMRDGLTVSEY